MAFPALPAGLSEEDVDPLISRALAEDLGDAGDITVGAVIPAGVRFLGVMAAREEIVVAGLPLAARIFARLSPDISFLPEAQDGEKTAAGAVLARIEGPAGALLSAERTALNLLQHLSGIATETRRYVEAILETDCVLLDTRKTIPGLRKLEKYATRMGGASNHRMGLYDAILIKDNHLAVTGSVHEAVRRARAAGHAQIEVECDTLAQAREALEAGADRLLLDNMGAGDLRKAVKLAAGRAKTEASGGITLETIAAIAATGVDFVSVGRITQSAPAVDIGLDWSAEQGAGG